MADRTFRQIMALLSEHDQLKDLHATVVNDAFIDLICRRLAEIPIPPVTQEEVRRAWVRERDSHPGPPPGFFDRQEGDA